MLEGGGGGFSINSVYKIVEAEFFFDELSLQLTSSFEGKGSQTARSVSFFLQDLELVHQLCELYT